MSHLRKLLITLFLLLGWVGCALAIPSNITYQAQLTDNLGVPLDGDFNLTFRIYETAISGSPIWAETQFSTISNGNCIVQLGSTETLANLPFDVPYYLGIQVESDPEMSPRRLLGSVGYAARAASVESIAENSITGDMIVDGAITAAKIASTCPEGDYLVQTASGWDCFSNTCFPQAEICDGIDNDCDGQIDEDFNVGVGCGTGACAFGVTVCSTTNTTTCSTGGNASAETCDGIDNDCDGTVDNNLSAPLCVNQSGICAGSTEYCGGSSGWQGCNSFSVPGYELFESSCDGLDNNCDGTIDNVDLDNDAHIDLACTAYSGLLPADDCDDTNIGINPGMPEICGNSFDEDCSGSNEDLDNDKDGFASNDPVCGNGSDCNDNDPMIYPGAPEYRDGKDNDCDTDGLADEGLLIMGDLVITEIMYDASTTLDSVGEWFEIYNPTARPVQLNGMVVKDDPTGLSPESYTVLSNVLIPPSDNLVLCNNSSPLYNGGVDCDYQWGQWSTMQLDNITDELILEHDGTIIDEVWYDEAPWPVAARKSLNLDPGSYTDNNNSESNWCEHPAGYPLASGDDATPGKPNISCTGGVAIVSVYPTNGTESGNTSVVIRGSGFTGATDVWVGGAPCSSWNVVDDFKITCTTPGNTGGVADVTVVKAGESAVLIGGFTYTTAASGAKLVDFAELNRPAEMTFARGWSLAAYGRVQESLVTGSCPATGEYAPNILIAEIGYGSLVTDPRADGPWVWYPAYCVGQPLPGMDEFKGVMEINVPGTYAYGFRFSLDGGLTWNYSDLDGTANGFSITQLGTITVR